MKKIIARLKREPILTRVGLAAVLNVLVVAGVLDTAASDAIEQALAGLVGVALTLSARQKVTPLDAITVAPEVAADLSALAHAVSSTAAEKRKH